MDVEIEKSLPTSVFYLRPKAMRKRLLSCLLLGATLPFVGCVDEKTADCKSETGVVYSYTLNDQNADLYDSEVNSVTLYLFDKNGVYYDSKTVADPALIKNDTPIWLSLPKGRYWVVTWGGDPAWYQLGEIDQNNFVPGMRPGVTKLDDMRLWIRYYLDSVTHEPIAEEPVDLYFGAPVELVAESGQTNLVRVGLIRNTHWIRLAVSEVRQVPEQSGSPLDIYLESRNVRYRFDDSIDPTTPVVKYLTAPHQYADYTVTTSTKVMRLVEGCPVMLFVDDKNTMQNVLSLDLVPLIQSLPAYATQEDLDREDLFNIELKLDNQVVVAVTINGWRVVPVIPEQ